MTGRLIVVGENIPAESSVVESMIDGKLYVAGQHAGTYAGNSIELLRKGFRAYVDDTSGEIREDDA